MAIKKLEQDLAEQIQPEQRKNGTSKNADNSELHKTDVISSGELL